MRYDTQANIQTNHYITFDTMKQKVKIQEWKSESREVLSYGPTPSRISKTGIMVQSLDQQSTIVEEEGIQLGSSVV